MDIYNKPPLNEYLVHHGIKGQKWGVRRYQRKDGSLTPAGRKRYNADISGSEKGSRKTEAKKSKHRMKLEKSYLEKGLTQEEAEIQAYKREKTEKPLLLLEG